MPAAAEILTRKIGPLPGWAWGVLVGGGAYFLLRGKTGSSGSGLAGLMGPAGPAGSSGATGEPGAMGAVGLQGATGDPGAQGTQGPAGAQGAPGTPATTAGFPAYPAWLEQAYTGSRADLKAALDRGDWGALQGEYSKEAIAWVKAHPGAAGGVGGAGRSLSIGNRSLDPHAYFHPSMKARVRYAHFVRTGIGGAGHEAAVHRTAHTAGIHPARLQALNPTPSGLLRIA